MLEFKVRVEMKQMIGDREASVKYWYFTHVNSPEELAQEIFDRENHSYRKQEVLTVYKTRGHGKWLQRMNLELKALGYKTPFGTRCEWHSYL